MDTENQASKRSEAYYELKKKQSVSIGYFAVGFILPVVGFILYGAWRNVRPGEAKGALFGALSLIAVYLLIRLLVINTLF